MPTQVKTWISPKLSFTSETPAASGWNEFLELLQSWKSTLCCDSNQTAGYAVQVSDNVKDNSKTISAGHEQNINANRCQNINSSSTSIGFRLLKTCLAGLIYDIVYNPCLKGCYFVAQNETLFANYHLATDKIKPQ